MVASKFKSDSHYQNFNFYNFESSSSLCRHRWYYFKEGFSTSLINEAITSYNGASTSLNILDPFCGCGTTPLQSALNNHKATAIEVNPFLAFTAKAKCIESDWDKSEFTELVDKIIKDSKGGKRSHLESFSTFTKRDDLKKWLFNIDVIRRFSAVIALIKEFSPIKYASNLKLSAIIAAFECCNARRDGKGLRYKKDWEEQNFSSEDFIKKFEYRTSLMLQDVFEEKINSSNKPSIIHGDSRNIIKQLNDKSYDLIITSPPYLNSFDYTDIYRAELFLGEYVKSNEELRNLRKNTLRSHVQVKWDKSISYAPEMLISINKELADNADKLWNKNIPYMVRAYFEDMREIFKSAYEKLKPGGEVWLVVSTSAYGGVHIPVDFILGEIFGQIGFQLDSIHCLRNLRTSSQQYKELQVDRPPLRESLIIARK